MSATPIAEGSEGSCPAVLAGGFLLE